MTLPEPVVARLRRLAPDQRAAATASPGPILCVAPAGSGKTTTLVARAAWLVGSRIEPGTICAVTFNRRAAEELRTRIDEALEPLGVEPGTVRVRTFHGLGREILVDGDRPVEPIADRAALLASLEGPRLTPFRLRHLDDAFSRLKLDLAVDTGDLRAAVAAAEGQGRPPGPVVGAFLRYEAALAETGALDFDDLVRGALRALDSDRPLLARWRGRCSHLLVDEVQDVDRSQLRLALLLAAPENRIFLVGDDDQTIYAWRLADVRRILHLAGSLPGLRRVDLVTNYRCPPAVVDRAVRLVGNNRERFDKTIRARPGATGSLRLAPDPADDLARARTILGAWRDADTGTCAVLARTNAELAPYAAVALERGIPYRAEDDGLLIDDPAVDAVLAAASSDPRGSASGAVGAVGAAGARSGPGVGSALAALARQARERADGQSAAWSAALAWGAGLPAHGDLATALDVARARHRVLRRDDATLILATVHSTKGLEFDRVAVVGLDADRFPSARSLDEAEDPDRALEEERRLAYVAWTRARRELLLVYDPGAPSRFMVEAFAPDELRPSGPRGRGGATPGSVALRPRSRAR